MMYSTIGNLGHAAVILCSGIFAYTVVFQRESGIFDPLWTQDGFCVSNKDVPYWTSHDLCLYFDTAAALVIGLMYLAMKKVEGMESANELIKPNVLGILAHGLGHGVLGKTIRDGAMSESTTDELEQAAAPFFNPGINTFWFFLLKATMPKAPNAIILPLSVIACAINLRLPEELGFTYVQTVLLLSSALDQLSRPLKEKDFAYGIFPLMVALPLTLVGWLESTNCTSIINIGGHLLYDAYIPISQMVFYLLIFATRDAGLKKKTE